MVKDVNVVSAARVRHRGGVVGGVGQELLPEALLDLPQIGGLPSEGGPMDLAERGEPSSVVPLEEEADALVGVEPEELSDDLDGQDLCVAELGGRPALADAPSLEPIVDEAEDGHDEGAKIHKKKTSFTPVGLVATERREVFASVQAPKKPAHEVNYENVQVRSRNATRRRMRSSAPPPRTTPRSSS